MGFWGKLLGRRGRGYVVREGFDKLPQEEWTDDEYNHWFRQLPEKDAWGHWEKWSRETAPHPRGINKIRRSCLEMALESARETDGFAIVEAKGATRGDDGGQVGAEFAAMLEVVGDTVTKLVLLPGTVAGDEHALLNTWMAPVDSSIRGTLHSHPDEHPYPSDADLEMFEQEGLVHLILCRPYGPDDWRAYDFRGMPVALEVI
jgi:proteasome lid subunit RPN8/RPN11